VASAGAFGQRSCWRCRRVRSWRAVPRPCRSSSGRRDRWISSSCRARLPSFRWSTNRRVRWATPSGYRVAGPGAPPVGAGIGAPGSIPRRARAGRPGRGGIKPTARFASGLRAGSGSMSNRSTTRHHQRRGSRRRWALKTACTSRAIGRGAGRPRTAADVPRVSRVLATLPSTSVASRDEGCALERHDPCGGVASDLKKEDLMRRVLACAGVGWR
jgi:hypothetical protein